MLVYSNNTSSIFDYIKSNNSPHYNSGYGSACLQTSYDATTNYFSYSHIFSTYPSYNSLNYNCEVNSSNRLQITNNGLVITDLTDPASALSGSLVIQHNSTSNGASSICFSSATVPTDYGFIQYEDTVNAGTGIWRLLIGIEKDAFSSTNQDFIQIASKAGVRIWSNYSQNLTLSTRDFKVIGTSYFDASANFNIPPWLTYSIYPYGTDISYICN